MKRKCSHCAEQVSGQSLCVFTLPMLKWSRVISTPGVSFGAARGLVQVQLAEEVGLALLGSGRVFNQKFHNVGVVLIASNVALVDDVHDAGQHIGGAAAKTHSAGRAASSLLLLTSVQYL